MQLSRRSSVDGLGAGGAAPDRGCRLRDAEHVENVDKPSPQRRRDGVPVGQRLQPGPQRVVHRSSSAATASIPTSGSIGHSGAGRQLHAAGSRRAGRPVRMAAGFGGGDQIRLGQHRQHRPGGGPDRGAVLGFDHLGEDVNVQVSVRSGCQRDGPAQLPARASACATVPRPTPARPDTATRSGVASRSAIAAQRGSRTSAANRSSSSTKIGLPLSAHARLQVLQRPILAEQLPIIRVAPPVCRSNGDICTARSESPDTSRRQLLGINLARGRRHDGFMGDDERMRAQPSVDAASPPTPSPDPACRASARLPPQHQLPLAAFSVVARAAADLGAAVAGAWLRRDDRRATPKPRANRWTPRPGSAATLRLFSKSAVAQGLRR